MAYQRFALYYMPPPEAGWSKFATAWLGWDASTGQDAAHPDVPFLPLPIEEITATPRRYGLHATMKPPFRLAPGVTPDDLHRACRTFCSKQAPVALPGLAVTRLGRFLALCVPGQTPALNQLAASCVSDLDAFRAPLTPSDLERRRASKLSPSQEANLMRWGYPHVMDGFRFHITLTGRLAPDQLALVGEGLRDLLTPLLPRPFVLDQLALAGEDTDGRFHIIHRYPLTGAHVNSTPA